MKTRTRTVFPSDSIAHRWAHQLDTVAIRNGHSDNVSAASGSLYSYWSQIGQIIKPGEAVILNIGTYSVTTSKHQTWARRAVSHYPHVFTVDVKHSAHAFPMKPCAIVDNYRERAVVALEKAARARVGGNREWLTNSAIKLIAGANDAIAYFKLRRKPLTIESLARDVAKRAKIETAARASHREAMKSGATNCLADMVGYPQSQYFPKHLEKWLTKEQTAQLTAVTKERRANQIREEVEGYISGTIPALGWGVDRLCPDDLRDAMLARIAFVEKDLIEQEIKDAEAFAAAEPDSEDSFRDESLSADLLARVNARRTELAAEKIAKWQLGELSYLSYDGPVLLRARDGQMQTSKGAAVPLADAERTFRFVLTVRARGWHRNGETHAIGHYQLDAVNDQGVIAGCHRVSWEEIERFAQAQGWETDKPLANKIEMRRNCP